MTKTSLNPDDFGAMIAKGFASIQADIRSLDQKVSAGFSAVDLKLTAQIGLWHRDFDSLRERLDDLEDQVQAVKKHTGMV